MHSSKDTQHTRASYQSVLKVMIPNWEKSEEPWGIKDTQSRFVYANAAYLELLNLPDNFNIDGRLDSDIPAPTAEYARLFQEHDRRVELIQKRVTSLETHAFGRQQMLKSYFFDKYPLLI